ncbi:hypothetical protein SAMN02910371_01897 [Butyrivibrio sp. INlla14]|nr:hypothetical protein SAMN02910371_01897 [Butyrivibrio sp. INlla14]
MIDFLDIFRIPNTRGFCGSSNPHVKRFANKEYLTRFPIVISTFNIYLRIDIIEI